MSGNPWEMLDRQVPPLVAVTQDDLLAHPRFLDRLRDLAEKGCPAFLMRSKRLTDEAFFRLVRSARETCDETRSELWVGRRADIALLAGAHGVQLPEAGLTVSHARAVVGEAVRIGRSIHSAEAAVESASEGSDHLIVGTIFPSPSHPGIEPAGVDLLVAARAALEERGEATPLIAIGGIVPERVEDVLAAGATSVAVVSGLWDQESPGDAVRAFLEALH